MPICHQPVKYTLGEFRVFTHPDVHILEYPCLYDCRQVADKRGWGWGVGGLLKSLGHCSIHHYTGRLRFSQNWSLQPFWRISHCLPGGFTNLLHAITWLDSLLICGYTSFFSSEFCLWAPTLQFQSLSCKEISQKCIFYLYWHPVRPATGNIRGKGEKIRRSRWKRKKTSCSKSASVAVNK